MIQNVVFVAHVNGAFSNAGLEPQEVCLVEMSTESSCIITFDTTNLNYHWLDKLYNEQNSNETHLIPFPFKGKMTHEDVRKLLKKLYLEKDEGKNSLVAVLGLKQQEFFQSCGLNTVWINLKLDLKLDELSDYSTPFMKCHKGQVNLVGLDHNCSRRKAYKIMHYLKNIKNAN
ncbi:hypothetical protein NPIL_431211 [Nephila pilipes]|uniref:Uncharacterized protein n=1 Tax=Nephila pilipes TaxID=299642 RepID=A0A8X6JEQ4_NEPPI|nr:hypothetical protein NPIL_431211 [Nephila pilipes]